jgi:NAD(P)-dependent dehydrogenase (short-subunit alcohol dehydrogenase family)
MTRKLEGKVAVITGGTSGIGLATARRFATEGARVFVTGRRQAELAAATAAIGPNATGVQADSANPADLDHLYERVMSEAGRVDVLFANAGGGSLLPLGSITGEQYDDTFGRNVKGVLFTVQKALPLLNDGASIVLVGSTAADRGVEAFGAYAASKAAVRSFARTWSSELKGRDIRVNVVSPAWIETPGGTAAFGDEETARAVKENVAATVPKGRMGRPEEAAAVVAFLASEQSSYVVGANLYVDGGENQI